MKTEMKENFMQRSFELNIRIMTLLGFYPDDKRSQVEKVVQYVVFLFFQVLSSLLTFMLVITQENTDIMEMNYVIMFLIGSISSGVKAFTFLKNGDRVKKCMNYFGNPIFAPKDVKEEEFVEESVSICRRNAKIYTYSMIGAVFIWIFPQFRRFKLPFEVWLPYDPKSGPVVFGVSFLYLIVVALYDVCIDTVLPLVGGLAHHAKTQIKILKYNLEHLDKYSTMVQTSVTFCSVCEFLRQCVHRHSSILNFVAEYEKCFSSAMFFQFACTMFTVCFCCIGLILGNTGSLDSFKNGAVIILSNCQLLFFCYYGTLLFEENDTLNDAIYMGPWYNYDIKVRKILIMVMERSKRPIIITAGKVMDVTLQTFASVLKSSYSLIAVFNRY